MNLECEKLLVRLAVTDAEEAVRVASNMKERVGGLVVGVGLLLDRGPILVGALCALGKPVLVDLGIIDAPEVVARAVARMGKLGARWVSVSGLVGRTAVRAAVAEASEYPNTSVVVSATLSGWAGEDELKGVGIGDTPGRQVSRMTRLAATSGAGGIVFPARELGVVAQVADSSRLGNSEGLSRMADTTSGLSSSEHMTEITDIIEGGADWVIVPQEAIGRAGEGK